MSRRIQIIRVTTTAEVLGLNPLYATTDYRLRVFSPTGKAEIEHDPEVLLLMVAMVVGNGGTVTGFADQWQINGAPAPARSQHITRVTDVLAGRIHSAKLIGDRLEKVKQEKVDLLFDAGEVVDSGKIWWRVASSVELPGAPILRFKRGELFTGAELLMRVANLLIHGAS